MHPQIDELLDMSGGACSRRALLTVASPARVGNEIRSGHLVRIFRRAYARPWMADLPEVRDRAAIASVGAPVAISHTSALRRWGLAVSPGPIHVTIPTGRRIHSAPGLVVHTTSRTLPCILRQGMLVAAPAAAVVQAWAMSEDRRAHAIDAVRRRLTTPAEIVAIAEAASRLPRRIELLELAELLASGCESELEIWGFLRVFDTPDLSHGRQQLTIRAAGARYRIDRAYESERVAVELDGDRFHSTREQRERDRRRDVALATIGWLTVRFSHRRLTSDPAGCQRELRAVLVARQR